MTYGVSTGTAGLLTLIIDGYASGMPRTFSYQSSHGCTDTLATGFFTGVGDLGRSTNNVGARVGDLVIVRASTNPVSGIAGRCILTSIIASTINQATTLASSAYNYGFDCSIASAT